MLSPGYKILDIDREQKSYVLLMIPLNPFNLYRLQKQKE